MEIDEDNLSVEESFGNILNKLQNISYPPDEEIALGAAIAIIEFLGRESSASYLTIDLTAGSVTMGMKDDADVFVDVGTWVKRH